MRRLQGPCWGAGQNVAPCVSKGAPGRGAAGRGRRAQSQSLGLLHYLGIRTGSGHLQGLLGAQERWAAHRDLRVIYFQEVLEEHELG